MRHSLNFGQSTVAVWISDLGLRIQPNPKFHIPHPKSIWLLALLVLLLTNCGSGDKSGQSTAQSGKLTIGLLVPEGSERSFDQMGAIDRYLTKKMGVQVKTIQLTHASAIIEAMRAKKIDVGSGGAFTYLVAHKKIGAEAIITTAQADGSPNLYTSCLITSAKSSVRSIDDMLKHPQTITLAWAYPTSTSGHLVPRYFLQQHGVMPTDFKEVFTSTDHASTMFSVVSQKVDVAAVMNLVLKRFLIEGKIKANDIRILWTSEPIPQGPYFVRSDMKPAIKQRIQQAFVTMEQEDSTARNALRTPYTQGTRYIAISNAYYDALLNMANQIKGLTLEEK